MKETTTLVAVVLLCLALVGCLGKQVIVEDPPIDGGVTDYTDMNAPKEIKSKQLTSFHTHFYVYDRYEYDEKSGIYDIEIADNEQGEHVLIVWGVHNHELVVDDQVLTDVQTIIDQYGLVQNNGAGRVTAGLPPEYEPWSLKAVYDSGEELSFYENGVPDADWTAAFRDYFLSVMAEAGFDDVLPAEEALTIQDFLFLIRDTSGRHDFRILQKENGACLFHRYWNSKEQTVIEYAEVTEELYTGLQEVIATTGLDMLEQPVSYVNASEPGGETFFEYHVRYESGRSIDGDFTETELPANWPEIKEVLLAFLNSYIDENLTEADGSSQ